MEILLFAAYSFAVAFVFYWLGYGSRSDLIKELRRDRINLERWCDDLAQAVIETDLELEIERMKHAG